MREFESVPKGFVTLQTFLKDNFKDHDRPALVDLRRKRAASRLKREIVKTPAYFRMLSGLSQAQLAEIIGSSQPAIARLEGGFERPSYEKMVKLKDALNVSYDQLMEAIGNVPIER